MPTAKTKGALKKRSYKKILEELASWEYHELLQQHSLKELKALKAKFESHRKKLVKALGEKEKKGEM